MSWDKVHAHAPDAFGSNLDYVKVWSSEVSEVRACFQAFKPYMSAKLCTLLSNITEKNARDRNQPQTQKSLYKK